MGRVIAAPLRDAGHSLPWGIARASFMPGLAPTAMDAVVEGQETALDRPIRSSAQ